MSPSVEDRNEPYNSDDARSDEEHPITSTTPLLKPKRPSVIRNFPNLLQNWWLWEIISIGTSVISITIISIILFLYDSSSLPDWPSVITVRQNFLINSLISFFGTIAKLSLGSATAAALSQSKWLWYRLENPRRLKDLQLFDDASRGPLGAAQLLWSLHIRHLAFLGATVTILSLLFDPFLQQVVVYPTRQVPAEVKSTIVRARTYQARSEHGPNLPAVVDLSMKSAVYRGIFDINDPQTEIPHTCSTGNCTWPNFASLAICNKCIDLSPRVKKECNETECYRTSLPAGPVLSGSGGQLNCSLTNISTSLNEINASVVRFSCLINKNTNRSDTVTATECSMWYCVQSYDTSIVDGKPTRRVMSSWRNDSAQLWQSSDLFYRPPSSIINSAVDPSEFRVERFAAEAMSSFMTEKLRGCGNITHTDSAFSSDIMQAIYTTNNLTRMIEKLAVSMTNNIRKQNSSESGPVLGTTWKDESYIRVRWRWFSFPITIVGLSLIFLIGAIFETSQREVLVWKSNILAILFHGRSLILNGPLQELRINKISRMNEQAKDIMIELTQTPDEDWKLVQR